MEKYLSPDQVAEHLPGMTKGQLAQLRFKGTGPRYRKPTPKTVLYLEADIIEWIENSARSGTAAEAV
jgi:predicted DNA-binding transcriptional regulator AlpA